MHARIKKRDVISIIKGEKGNNEKTHISYPGSNFNLQYGSCRL
jgi:hypothetical protein